MGQLYNRTDIVDNTPTITAGAYSANDVIGGLMTLDVANAGGGGLLRRVIVADDDDEKAAMDLYLFTVSPTSIADNAAFAPLIADLKALVGKVSIAAGDYTTVNGNAYAIKEDLNIDFVASKGALYVYAVVTGTPTYAATSDLTFRFSFWLDG